MADQDIDTRYELYRVNLASPGVATKLNPQLLTNRDVMDFVQSPDGSKVVYRADDLLIGLYDLYVVDVTSPGSATKLSGTLTAGGSVRSGYSISPDSARVLYRADQQMVDRLELFSVEIASPGVVDEDELAARRRAATSPAASLLARTAPTWRTSPTRMSMVFSSSMTRRSPARE